MPKFGCFRSEHQALLFSSFARLMIKVIVLTGVASVFITSIVWTTCKKPYSKGTSTYPRQSLDGSDDNPTMNPMSNWPVEKSEATKFTCPLLQRPGEWLDCGWVCEWTSKCREENLARDDEDYSPDAAGHDTGDDLENHLASRQALSLNKDLMSASPQGSNRNRRYGSPIYLVLESKSMLAWESEVGGKRSLREASILYGGVPVDGETTFIVALISQSAAHLQELMD